MESTSCCQESCFEGPCEKFQAWRVWECRKWRRVEGSSKWMLGSCGHKVLEQTKRQERNPKGFHFRKEKNLLQLWKKQSFCGGLPLWEKIRPWRTTHLEEEQVSLQAQELHHSSSSKGLRGLHERRIWIRRWGRRWWRLKRISGDGGSSNRPPSSIIGSAILLAQRRQDLQTHVPYGTCVEGEFPTQNYYLL